MIPTENYLEVLDLFARYAHAIDNDQLEQWVECFAPQCQYKIITIENVQQGLEAGMMTCNSRAMLLDRVAYIRKAAVFNMHRDRHILSHPLIESADGGFKATTGFTVYQSEPDRESRLFALGYYDDRIVRVEGQLKFASRVAVLENNSIKPLLSSPI
jgi:3-phenylpropionate/cinnamic acid dioxygenase small subunit